MPGRKNWEEEEEEEESSSPPSSPPVGAVRRAKFDDEEGEDSDVLDSWDAAEDSEAEREKAEKAEKEAKAAAEAAAAKKKPRGQRIEEHIAERARQKARAEEEDSDDEETEAERRDRLRRTEKESDLRHAEDLFAGAGGGGRRANTAAAAVLVDPEDPTSAVDLAALPLFSPTTKAQFERLRETLVPLLAASAKQPHYVLFLQELAKQLARDLPSDQIKKVASSLTTLGNEKMKSEKAADKSGKKSKAQKTKKPLVANRSSVPDVNAYDGDAYDGDAFDGGDDFM